MQEVGSVPVRWGCPNASVQGADEGFKVLPQVQVSERVGNQIVDVTGSHVMTEIAEVAKVTRESSASALAVRARSTRNGPYTGFH